MKMCRNSPQTMSVGFHRPPVQCGGTITSDGGAPVTAWGVFWSTNPTPLVSGNKTTDGSGKGSFTSNITGLTANSSYSVRVYATNKSSFTALPGKRIDIDIYLRMEKSVKNMFCPCDVQSSQLRQ